MNDLTHVTPVGEPVELPKNMVGLFTASQKLLDKKTLARINLLGKKVKTLERAISNGGPTGKKIGEKRQKTIEDQITLLNEEILFLEKSDSSASHAIILNEAQEHVATILSKQEDEKAKNSTEAMKTEESRKEPTLKNEAMTSEAKTTFEDIENSQEVGTDDRGHMERAVDFFKAFTKAGKPQDFVGINDVHQVPAEGGANVEAIGLDGNTEIDPAGVTDELTEFFGGEILPKVTREEALENQVENVSAQLKALRSAYSKVKKERDQARAEVDSMKMEDTVVNLITDLSGLRKDLQKMIPQSNNSGNRVTSSGKEVSEMVFIVLDKYAATFPYCALRENLHAFIQQVAKITTGNHNITSPVITNIIEAIDGFIDGDISTDLLHANQLEENFLNVKRTALGFLKMAQAIQTSNISDELKDEQLQEITLAIQIHLQVNEGLTKEQNTHDIELMQQLVNNTQDILTSPNMLKGIIAKLQGFGVSYSPIHVSDAVVDDDLRRAQYGEYTNSINNGEVGDKFKGNIKVDLDMDNQGEISSEVLDEIKQSLSEEVVPSGDVVTFSNKNSIGMDDIDIVSYEISKTDVVGSEHTFSSAPNVNLKDLPPSYDNTLTSPKTHEPKEFLTTGLGNTPKHKDNVHTETDFVAEGWNRDQKAQEGETGFRALQKWGSRFIPKGLRTIGSVLNAQRLKALFGGKSSNSVTSNQKKDVA